MHYARTVDQADSYGHKMINLGEADVLEKRMKCSWSRSFLDTN